MEAHLYHSKFLFVLLVFVLACQSSSNQSRPSPAFYHWKTTLAIDSLEQHYLDHLQVSKLYVRFFDVDWDANRKEAIPLAQLQVEAGFPKGISVIPTIFITNRTLLQATSDQLSELARKMQVKIEELWQKFPKQTLSEIQLDCDWTGKSRGAYFQLLHLLQKRLGDSVQLSATIRLHQVKYPRQTGIPPVARGMLMFYNTGTLDLWDTQNSILDINTAKAYLGKMADYPLHLDIALPLFRWAIVFRDDKLLHLINELGAETLADSSRFQIIQKQRYQVIRSTYLQGHYLYEGDQIRLEEVDEEQLLQSADLLKKNIRNSDISVVFYHLDSVIVQRYPPVSLSDVITRFVQ